ncbi:MAG TPA: carboxypeptidase regulatory-like domain-containing protein [Kofleriaceae bacterium]|nr:carboxypeptidase regulatory-like domain-containing protein [Kofleriaceae bacterium]
MSRKTLGAALALAIAAAAVWFFFLRSHGDASAPAPAPIAKAPPAPPSAPAKTSSDQRSPRGRAPAWTLDLDPEGPLRLEGQVVDRDGHGLGGAEVWLASVPPRSVKTQDDGSFAFDQLVGRTYELTASAGALVGGPVSYKLTQASDPVVIALREAATIEVTVSDERTQPIANAEVTSPGLGARTATTDDHGKATLAVRPGWIDVEANAAGFPSGHAFTSVGSAGGKGTVAITLRRGAAVSGRVVDEQGHPLAKVKVAAGERGERRRGPGERASPDEQTTDDQGKFAFPALAPGRHTLAASDGEHAPTNSNPITVAADRPVTGVELVMKAGAAISGQVVDSENKPVAYATVRVAGKGGEMWRIAARQATTDQRGQFELRGLARAKLQVRAEAETTASTLVDVDTTAIAAKKDLRLVLDVAGAIAGTVVDDQGQPVAEVQVNAFPDILGGASTDGLALAGMSSATTDGGGRFAIHGLPDGSYRLWADRHAGDGWGKQSTPAKVGDTSVRIVLPATGSLVGKLVLETGAVPKLAYVELGSQAATPAVAGAFEIKDLAAGPYDMHVWGPEFTELVKRDVKIEPGKATDLGTLTVVRGRRLVGRVVDASGTPAAGVHVKLGQMLFSSASGDDDSSSDDFSGLRSGDTDQTGTFVITGVPPKGTVVMADDPVRGQSLAQNVPGGTDDPPAVTLALRGFGSIAGRVTQKGAPLANVAVSETSKGGGPQAGFVETGADGTFTMPKVPEGTIIVAATQMQMMAMKSTSQTVQVVAGQTTQVAIDMPVGTISLVVQVQATPGNQVNAAQVFLLAGNVTVSTGKQLVDGLFQGAMQGMKLWFGNASTPPEFDDLVPGSFSVCTIPLTGDLSDPTFLQRVQENIQTLAVYCKPVTVNASPASQTFVDAVPSMTPLPGTGSGAGG